MIYLVTEIYITNPAICLMVKQGQNGMLLTFLFNSVNGKSGKKKHLWPYANQTFLETNMAEDQIYLMNSNGLPYTI
jgi:hypothetical protein